MGRPEFPHPSFSPLEWDKPEMEGSDFFSRGMHNSLYHFMPLPLLRAESGDHTKLQRTLGKVVSSQNARET